MKSLNALRATLLLSLSAFAAHTATAQPPAGESGADAPKISVYYGDLNLDNPTGIAQLYRRVERAAARLCERPGARSAQSMGQARACQAETVARAVSTLHVPQLAQYYAARIAPRGEGRMSP